MKCSDCQLWLSAYLDDELDPEVMAKVSEHCDSCKACRCQRDELRTIDRQLARLKLPAKPVYDQLRIAKGSKPSIGLRAKLVPWALGAALLAASILMVASLSWQVHRDEISKTIEALPAPEVHPIQLVRATGDIEVFDSKLDRWTTVAQGTDVGLGIGDRVRTFPSVTCELKTEDRGTIRLNEQAEVRFVENDRIECVSGQVWMRADSGAIQVQSAPPKSFRCEINTGQCVAMSDEIETPTVTPAQDENWRAKIWQLPLLAIGAPSDSELSQVMEGVLASLGASKESFLIDHQLRALGPRGAIPLLAYVASERSRSDLSRRMHAMQLGCEMADATALGRLANLAKDDSPEIAETAIKAIERIDGH